MPLRTSMEFLARGGTGLVPLFKSSSLRRCALIRMSLHAHILTLSNQLAAKLKLNAPYAHTWLEIVHARWGRTAHLIFMFFGSAALILSYVPSLTCLIQASNKYHRFFYANPWWLCNGERFNWYAHHSCVLPYPTRCCNLCRRWRYAGDATL